MFAMLGNLAPALRRIAAGNRWLVIAFAVLAGLWALEYLAHGAIGVMRDLMTLGPSIKDAKGRAEEAKAKGDAAASDALIGAPSTARRLEDLNARIAGKMPSSALNKTYSEDPAQDEAIKAFLKKHAPQ